MVCCLVLERKSERKLIRNSNTNKERLSFIPNSCFLKELVEAKLCLFYLTFANAK